MLAPKNMLIPSENIDCVNEIKADRLLLIKVGSVRKNYSNLIRNNFGLGSIGMEFIEKTSAGFKLNNHLGQSCYLDYNLYIEYYKNDFYITEISAKSDCLGEGTKQKSIKYKLSDYNLSYYNRGVIDSLLISG